MPSRVALTGRFVAVQVGLVGVVLLQRDIRPVLEELVIGQQCAAAADGPLNTLLQRVCGVAAIAFRIRQHGLVAVLANQVSRRRAGAQNQREGRGGSEVAEPKRAAGLDGAIDAIEAQGAVLAHRPMQGLLGAQHCHRLRGIEEPVDVLKPLGGDVGADSTCHLRRVEQGPLPARQRLGGPVVVAKHCIAAGRQGLLLEVRPGPEFSAHLGHALGAVAARPAGQDLADQVEPL
jgi:hypothetical protein